MSTLAGNILAAGAENRPPMLEKGGYDTWQSQTEREADMRMLTLAYLTPEEKIRKECEIKAANIILHGELTKQERESKLADEFDRFTSEKEETIQSYYMRFAKLMNDINIIGLMQGTSLSKQKRECKLYDEFDKFSHVKGETLYEYYLRFAQLINDMDIIQMTMQSVQVNTKFLNSLPPKWSKFVTDVKLARDLHTSNYDQLYAYLEQHKAHAKEARLMHERFPDPLALVANYHQPPSHFNNYHS
ncbi:hypothetical protein Tco_0116439 [Tanacetum coccineum]